MGLRTRFDRLEKMVGGPHLDMGGRSSPYKEVLEAALVDPGVKITGLKSFEGGSDPNDHLSYYENLMICHHCNYIAKCHPFISTCKAYARTWFSGLPSRSVGPWKEFEAVFLTKFRVNSSRDVHTIFIEMLIKIPESPYVIILKILRQLLRN